jgi:hypothetical protein
MRAYVPLALLLPLLLTSCGSLPKPQAGSDQSLVIGSFRLDFPDGYFKDPPRGIDSGIAMDIANQTKGSSFTVVTGKGGYFYFLSNGTDEYLIKSFQYDETSTITGGTSRLSGTVGTMFKSSPRCVVYLGHTALRYMKPKLEDQGMTKPGSVESSWNYAVSQSREDRRDELRTFLENSDWAGYEMR